MMGVLDAWQDQRIETAVGLLLAAADSSGCFTNSTWSMAEIGLTPLDLDRLLGVATRSIPTWEWVLRRDFQPLSGSVQLPETLGTMAPTAKEALGLLFIALLAGLSRRYGNTEACFRPCQRHLPEGLRNLLFQGSTLHRLVQPAIEEASSRFRLRLAGPEHSFQRWYLTVRLHEGLPINNLKNRLPAWLHGDNLPLHLTLLLAPGSLHAPSFKKVWHQLLRFARTRAFHQEWDRMRLTLENSIWFQGQNIDELLDAITSFQPPVYLPTTPGAVIPTPATEEDISEIEVATELRLDVASLRPLLKAHSPASALGAGLMGVRYEVHIEGAWQDALLRDPDGELRWMEGGWLEVPFRPTCAVQLLDEEDQPVPGDFCLRLFSEEEVRIFDDQGNPAQEPLQTSCGYWFLAPQGAVWEQAPPEARSIPRQERALLWLPPGWSPQVALRLDGELLWSPTAPRPPRPLWLEQIRLEANPANPGEFEILKPAGCILRAAWVEGTPLPIRGGNLLHLPATREPLVEVRMEVRHEERSWMVRRRVATRAALLLADPREEQRGWRECRPGEELDLRALEATPVRFCALPHQTSVFFEQALGCPLPRRTGILRGMLGRGEQMALGPEHPRNPEDLTPLGVTVVHRGLIRRGSVEEGRLKLVLRRKIQLRPEHRVLLWFKGRPPQLAPIMQDGDELVIPLTASGEDLYAAALVFRNTWLGVWWTEHWWQCLEDSGISELECFLWLRWMRLPLLSTPAQEKIRNLARRAPTEALLAWEILPREQPDDPANTKERIRQMMQPHVEGGAFAPEVWPDGESWRQVVRSLLLGTDFDPTAVQRMYTEVHERLLHRPVSRALLPWGRALLEVSERWPLAACQCTSEQERRNAPGRRIQWRCIYLHIEPGQTVTKPVFKKALKALKEQAAAALRLPLDELERLLEEACSTGRQTVASLAALHLGIFRRLVAVLLLEKGMEG
ncbi:MAG: hypothetical protein RMJ98_09375 [Myxococcales bacterium]|nr:hypothetical protein [Polyangiaceae bacterium]MDW8249497.1 hypothetical protein [Myxococcales bacterium]